MSSAGLILLLQYGNKYYKEILFMQCQVNMSQNSLHYYLVDHRDWEQSNI